MLKCANFSNFLDFENGYRNLYTIADMRRIKKTYGFLGVFLLAHLSRKAHKVCLKYTHRASVRPSASVRQPFSKIFSSETAWPIKAKFHVQPP